MQEEFTFNPFLNQRAPEEQTLISPDAQTPQCTPVREIMKTKKLNFHNHHQKLMREKLLDLNRERMLVQQMMQVTISDKENEDLENWTAHKIEQIDKDDLEEFYQQQYLQYESDLLQIIQQYEEDESIMAEIS